MTDYDKICDFQNLMKAHKKARLGKRDKREVIEFEINLAENICDLQKKLQNKTYKINGYYNFTIHDPKVREIHALHYRDRVVQHCLCDEVLEPLFEKRLIYDNSACRIGKGTHFSIYRLSDFLRRFYKQYGTDGYILKCDIKKYFDNIDHSVLKSKLSNLITDDNVRNLLYNIIDSYSKVDEKGLPLGNQTSQWFALYYLDGVDRLIKENLRIKYYTRYMDDFILIHNDKKYLQYCFNEINQYLQEKLFLQFNQKTQIFPIKNGVEYLGFRFYLTDTGKVLRNLKKHSKRRISRRIRKLTYELKDGMIDYEKFNQSMASFKGHLKHGNTYVFQKSLSHKIYKQFTPITLNQNRKSG